MKYLLVIIMLSVLLLFEGMHEKKHHKLKKSFHILGHMIDHPISGSMCPTIKVGQNVVVRKKTERDVYEPGDIILFHAVDGLGRDWTLLHRIESVTPQGTFITCGDANPRHDPGERTIDDIYGKVVFICPKL